MKRGLSLSTAAAGLLLLMAGLSQSQTQYPPYPPTPQPPPYQPPQPRPRPVDPMEPVPFHPRESRIGGWKLTIPGGRPLATPAVAEGKLYLGGGFGSHEFYGFDAVSGRRIWTYHTADDGPTAAVVEDGLIAFNTESCELEILTSSGRPLWKKWLGDPLMSMPAMADGRVYMAFPDSRGRGTYYLAAFDLRGGAELWRTALPGEIITAPVVDRDRIYVSTVGGMMVALNRRDGSRIWEESRNATSAPAIWNERAFFSRREVTQVRQQGGVMAAQQTEVFASKGTAAAAAPSRDMAATQRNADYLDYGKRAQGAAEQQSQAYDAAVGFAGSNKGSAAMAPAQANLGQASVHGIWSYQGSKPFISNGRLYSSMGDSAQCVDAQTGRVIWSRNFRDVRRPGYADDILTPPAVVNGKVFVGTRWGYVYALSAETGDAIWRVDIGEPVTFQPAVAMGRVYVGTDRGSVFCLETGDPRDDGWMMWGGNARHNGLNGR